MVKSIHTDTRMAIEPLLDMDKTMARKPTQKLILFNNLQFKTSSYNALKNQRTNTKETYLLNDISYRRKLIMAIMTPNGKSNGSFIFTHKSSHKACHPSPRFISSVIPYLPFLAIQGLNFQNLVVVIAVIASTSVMVKFLQISKYWKWLMILFNKYCVKEKPVDMNKAQKTSAALRCIWRLFDKDLLFSPDVHRIEHFTIVMGILLAWWVLSQLVSFVRRSYRCRENYKNYP